MSSDDPDPLKKDDKRFKRRLARRDRSVMDDIAAAYKPAMLALIRQNLQAVDAEGVFNEALQDLWKDYSPEKATTVRGFLSVVAKRRMIDEIRKQSRLKRRVSDFLDSSNSDQVLDSQTSDHQVLSREDQEEVDAMLRLVHRACSELTPQQQTAFRRRFLGTAEMTKHWAKTLESETQIPAKTWRKRSHVALSRVKELVKLYQSEDQGECHDVA